MKPSRVRERWAAGQPAFCVGNHLTDPSVAEMMGALDFDCIWIDLEHHGTSVETLAAMCRGVRAGGASDVMARPGKGEFMRMSRMLEVGATGILYPRCDDAAEAAEVVRWAKYAPLGERGFDGGNADNRFGLAGSPAEYTAAANEQTWVAVQVESPEAARHARAMAEVPGVDMIFFGPADYSLLTGAPGSLFDNADVLAAAEAVCRETLAAGKQFGTLVFNDDQARHFVNLGARFIAYGFDLSLLRRSLIEHRETFARLASDTES